MPNYERNGPAFVLSDQTAAQWSVVCCGGRRFSVVFAVGFGTAFSPQRRAPELVHSNSGVCVARRVYARFRRDGVSGRRRTELLSMAVYRRRVRETPGRVARPSRRTFRDVRRGSTMTCLETY